MKNENKQTAQLSNEFDNNLVSEFEDQFLSELEITELEERLETEEKCSPTIVLV